MIMDGDYVKTEVILLELINEITRFQKTSEKYKSHFMLFELHCWALNRLGVVYRLFGKPLNALELMKKSLLLAKKIRHEYFIHHNYYDMAGCLVQLDKVEDAYEMHKRCLMPVLDLPEQVNALLRSKIRTGLFHILLNDSEKAATELETAVQIARERGYLWELTRGLINQANLYFQQKKLELAQETYKTCLHFVDIHNAKTFYSCLYNNLAFLYLHNYQNSKDSHLLEMSLDFFLKSMEEIDTASLLITRGPQNIHSTISILNLLIYKELLDRHSGDYPNTNDAFREIDSVYHKLLFLKPTLVKPDFIQRFDLKLSEDLSFYLMYMSFT
jgi:tetratricopeptide (TPR) repeat protein